MNGDEVEKMTPWFRGFRASPVFLCMALDADL
jgi:hypothetical protein